MATTPPHLPDDLESHQFDGLDGIMDDLLSMGSPSRLDHHSDLHHHHRALDDNGGGGAESPTMESIMSGDGTAATVTTIAQQLLTHSPDSPDPWRLSNAVHMELQENAKLPTFHWTVDRTGSVSYNDNNNNKNRRSWSDDNTATAAAAVDAQNGNNRLTDASLQQQPSLMEAFLSSESRAGRHANYAHAGALRYDAATTALFVQQQQQQQHRICDQVPHTFREPANPLRGAPLQQQLHHDKNGPLQHLGTDWAEAPDNNDDDFAPTPLSEMKRRLDIRQEAVRGAGRQSLLPFSDTQSTIQYMPRQYPLPIPTMVAARATASASATTAPATATVSGGPMPATQPVATAAAAAAMTLIAKNTAPDSPWSSLASKPPPKHSVAQAVPRPALQSASQKQSQYGFGRKHVVPSVPAAPRSAAENSSRARKHAQQQHQQQQQQRDDDDDSGGGGGSTDAYERKKQRAKTARIKLNESIDRLQVAISVAGTQSKQRVAHFEPHTVTFRIIQDCVKTSADAKKWDRPSFVGSAASMIQALNAQCEALMRALHSERMRNKLENGVNATNGSSLKHSHDAIESSTVGANNRVGDDDNDNDDSPAKRQRRNGIHGDHDIENSITSHQEDIVKGLKSTPSPETAADTLVFGERTVMDRVASFLDPLSLVRCTRVSKAWNEWGIFLSDPLWQNLAVERFGYFNVRQWRGKFEDEEAGVVAPSVILYKQMDAVNVMPHFRHEGMLLLGETCISGKVSAWTFLVERSNGETMRSVQRHPSMPGDGLYSSIPVVQLWTVIQNTGIHDEDVVIREQTLTVDASTRRRGEEMKEIEWDDRFRKRILNLDGSAHVSQAPLRSNLNLSVELCRLRLFRSVIVETNIYAKGCSTTSKFVQRSNFTKVLVQIRDGTTVPLVIPFPRDAVHLLP